MDIKIKYENVTDELIDEYETLRLDAYQKENDLSNTKNNMKLKMIGKRLIIVGIYIDGIRIGGCYVTYYKDYLFIEQLFIKYMYQGSGLRLGRMLLGDILNNRDYLIEYFKKEFMEARLFYVDEKSKSLYLKMGFSSIGDTIMLRKEMK